MATLKGGPGRPPYNGQPAVVPVFVRLWVNAAIRLKCTRKPGGKRNRMQVLVRTARTKFAKKRYKENKPMNLSS